jgi:hypothetical protein
VYNSHASCTYHVAGTLSCEGAVHPMLINMRLLLLAAPKLPSIYSKWLLQVTFHLSLLLARLPACLLAGRLRLRLCMYILYVKVDCGASSVPSSAGSSSPGKVLYWSIQTIVVQRGVRRVGNLGSYSCMVLETRAVSCHE